MVNDESFYNVFGEEVSRTGLVEEMIGYYELKLENGETILTDFNEGSEIRNILESFAVDIYVLMRLENGVTKQAFIDSADGEWLDKIGNHPSIQLERQKGDIARGTVTFSLPEPVVTDYLVPNNTILSNSVTGLYYRTTGDCSIAVGETSGSVSAECLTVGSDGNCESNTLTIIADEFFTDDRVSVTNTDAFEMGTDYEEDWLYRERLLSFVRKDDFGSLPYYIDLAEGITGVHDVLFVEDDNNVYTRIILVNGDVKPTPDTVLLDVLTEFTQTSSHILDQSFSVAKPSYLTKNLSISFDVAQEISEDTITKIIEDFIDGGARVEGYELEGVHIGQDVAIDDLYSLFDIIDDVISVSIEVDGSQVSVIEVDDDEVLKLGTLSINQTVVE